jgi:hypothetical protein
MAKGFAVAGVGGEMRKGFGQVLKRTLLRMGCKCLVRLGLREVFGEMIKMLIGFLPI